MLTLLLLIMAVIIFVAYILQTRELSDKQAQCQILRERGAIASRMLFSYCRRLLLDDAAIKMVYTDDVLFHLNDVLNVLGYEPPGSSAVSGLPSADSAEGV